MKRTRLIAVLVVLATVAIVTVDASAMYHPTMGRFMQRDPGAGEATRLGAAGPATGGSFVQRDPVGPNAGGLIHNQIARMQVPQRIRQAGLGGQYQDGMNLYQYVASNPLVFLDPQGTDIYLKRGNNTWNPVNNAIHMQVCVDTEWSRGKKGEDLICFSFALKGVGLVLPGKWLGWWNPIKTKFGWPRVVGEIYEAPNAGKVVMQKKTTCEQDKKWFLWMVDKRLGEKDLYDSTHQCVSYSINEYRDAPGNH